MPRRSPKKAIGLPSQPRVGGFARRGKERVRVEMNDARGMGHSKSKRCG